MKIGPRCINAMAETVATKPAFRDAFKRGQRCLVPADFFYEWQKLPVAASSLTPWARGWHPNRNGRAMGALEGAG